MTLTLPPSEIIAGKLCGAILLKKGLLIPQAAGVLSSFQGETDFVPRPGDHGKAFGLGQWKIDRVLAMAAPPPKGCGIDVRDAPLADQVDAFWWEITHGGEGATYRALLAAATAEEAAAAMVNLFERPTDRAAAIARRTPYALFWEAQLSS